MDGLEDAMGRTQCRACQVLRKARLLVTFGSLPIRRKNKNVNYSDYSTAGSLK